ncbi:phosphate acyltransferase [Anaerotruncus colihominis]|uniref:Phosphate acetyl/butaryl transferase domain-containing protein n=1 Tax=Anaerotruncus colihominis TaxID=169435 RepID=A0A845SY69_9FIRM|nr:phosphate acyltransferase [Anaerotruncus colihominis]MCR2026309.1 phosphate acyltransferase [Anaerotruncus colihominis]NDO38857.1 hypothetical protein [Anaerotruncus colihominis]
MFKSFQEIEHAVLDSAKRARIALAGAHDLDALSSLVRAREAGIAHGILIGRTEQVREILKRLGQLETDWELIEEPDAAQAAARACRLVKAGEADIPMKGIMQTADFMRAILDKSNGFVPEKQLLSQATVFEFQGRLMVASDCAVNIAPEYPDKVKITQNAVDLARRLGCECPKVAVLAPVEMVNPAMISTVDAAMLSKAAERGQIKNCIVDGPLALDNALSKEAARHKGITGPVAGEADVLILPDLASGNIFTKSLTYVTGLPTAGVLNGTTVPVIMTSRTDRAKDKYHAVLIAVMQAVS